MTSRWRQLKASIIILFSLIATAGAAYGIFRAIHSPLFLVRVVEVADLPENSPVDAQEIESLAAVPVGTANLYDLKLDPIEKRILTQPWIREVHLQKRFPQTLAISVVFREPHALIQGMNGALSYVDSDGKPFGNVNLSLSPDLPVLAGFTSDTKNKISESLKLIDAWGKSELGKAAQLSSISYDSERGFRALVTYPMKTQDQVQPGRSYGRAVVDLGHDFDAETESQLERLDRVIKYLGINNVAARQIWADAGKKIVVKIAKGS